MNQLRIFISYSHKDEKEKDELITHLRAMLTHGHIEAWHDNPVEMNVDWEREIKRAINNAKIAILLVTSNFLTSHFIMHNEVYRLFERQESEGLDVFPVIARACAWRHIPWLKEMNVLPKTGKPIWTGTHSDVESSLFVVAKEIENVFSREISESTSTPVTQKFSGFTAIADSEGMRNYTNLGVSVPTFFRDNSEPALIKRVEWLREKLDLDDGFFSRLLGIGENQFHIWRILEGPLPEQKLQELREFWEVILHLLSFLNLDIGQVQIMLEHKEERSVKLPFDPPWIGTSMKTYLEANGRRGVQNLSRWLQSFQFADRYSTSWEDSQWL